MVGVACHFLIRERLEPVLTYLPAAVKAEKCIRKPPEGDRRYTVFGKLRVRLAELFLQGLESDQTLLAVGDQETAESFTVSATS